MSKLLCGLLFFTFSIVAGISQPNIIIIFTDDMGYGDLACYGHPSIQTPQLDQMAREGMRFSQFYAAASVCTPSRAGLLTGRYPIRTRMVEGMIPARVLFPSDKTGLPLSEVTIAEVLKAQNYQTYMVGKWHLGHLPQYLPIQQGFDHYYGIPYSNDMDHVGPKDGKPAYWNVPLMQDSSIIERPADQTTLTRRYTEKAVQFIQNNKGRPFFLYLAHTMPHVPLFASKDFLGKSKRGLYGDVIEEIDWSVGQILQTLKANQLDKNTLVVFTSDNGPWLVQNENGGSAGLLKAGKGTTWEGGMRVPMIAWWPGSIPAGQTSATLATTLDLLPTIAELASADIPEAIDGLSMAQVLKGEAETPREFFAFYRGTELFAVRYGPWKAHYITQTSYPAGPKEYHNPPLLYHLENDPSERFNVAENHKEVIQKIDIWVDAHLKTIKTDLSPSIEAESLLESSKVSGGRLQIQNMENFGGQWSGNQHLWWVEAKPGDRLELPIEAKQAGKYELFGFFTRAGDYGIIKVSLNGKSLGVLMDGYTEGVEPTGPVPYGLVNLKKGKNTLTIELIGKDYRAAGYSDGYLVGIDGFLLK